MSLLGIEKDIYSVLEKDNPSLRRYGLKKIKEQLRRFLAYDENKENNEALRERKDLSVEMTSKILAEHGKAPMFVELLDFLERIETGAQFFDEHLRDHLVHSFNTYLLGLYFMCKVERIEGHMRHIDPLVWKLSSLLHDVGYPVEILYGQMERFFQKIDTFKQDHLPKKPDSSRLRFANLLKRGKHLKSSGSETWFENLETLYRGDNSFKLIEHRVAEYGFDIDLKQYFYKKVKEGFVDHGILSALIVLNLIDALYAEHNPKNLLYLSEETEEKNGSYEFIDWGRQWFDGEVVDAAAVISLHNLVNDPILHDYQIPLEKTPTLYLLVLSDNIQVWRRHSVFRKVYPPDAVSILFNPKEIRCTLAIADEEKSEAKNVLERRLIDGDMVIKVQ